MGRNVTTCCLFGYVQKCWQRFGHDIIKKNTLLYMQQIVGPSLKSQVSRFPGFRRLTIQPTPPDWWPRNPWSATLTYQTKKVWHGKQMDGGQVIKGFRVIQGSRFTSWSSILNSRRLKVQAITTPTFKGLSIYAFIYPGMNVHVNYTNATNEPVQDCSTVYIYNKDNFQKVGTWLLLLGHWRMSCVI